MTKMHYLRIQTAREHTMPNLYRLLPSVDICLQSFKDSLCPYALLRNTVNSFLDTVRNDIKNDRITETDLEKDVLTQRLISYVERKTSPTLKKVINASGVIIHTNLGRSVLAQDAIDAVHLAASSYCNLEFDLETGERGSRHTLVEKDICALVGAESALVVNNNAAAVLLMLNSLCLGGETVVSRGQLVEIGGSFRIPDVMEKSGCRLKEVGTTNRCHKHDYENAITGETKALLRVHTSNYRVIGFHSDVPTEEMAKIAHAHGLPLLEDLGSGSLIDFSPYGLPGEPTVKNILSAGVDVVTFSGDKVLGGPQAGIIAGKKIYIDCIKKNQLLRALRCDKLTLAALEATLRLYYDPEKALREIPTLRRMTISQSELKKKAQKLHRALSKNLDKKTVSVHIKADASRVGGGSFPENDLPTYLVTLKFLNPHTSTSIVRQKLLSTTPPVIGRIENDMFMLDVRTLEEKDYPLLANIFQSILAH